MNYPTQEFGIHIFLILCSAEIVVHASKPNSSSYNPLTLMITAYQSTQYNIKILRMYILALTTRVV